MRRPEDALQRSVITYLRFVAPWCVSFAIPNGGGRSKAEAAILKATGTLAGIPDIAIIAPGGKAYFLELKAPKGRISPAQKIMHEELVARRIPLAIIRSLDDARDALKAWNIANREIINGGNNNARRRASPIPPL